MMEHPPTPSNVLKANRKRSVGFLTPKAPRLFDSHPSG